jgi:hypothetical protein
MVDDSIPVKNQLDRYDWISKAEALIPPEYILPGGVIGFHDRRVHKTTHSELRSGFYGLEDQTILRFQLKHHLPLPPDSGVINDWFKDPDSLHVREIRNMETLREIYFSGFIPLIYRSNASERLILMEHAEGKSMRQILREQTESLGTTTDEGALDSLQSERKRSLYELVGHVAYLVGIANSSSSLDKIEASYYREESPRFIQARSALQLENLRRIFALRKLSIPSDLELRVSSLQDILKNFTLRDVYCHGDLNAEHIIIPTAGSAVSNNPYGLRGKVLDWETFGLGKEPDDLSSALIIEPIGRSAIIKEREFSNLIFAYLAMSHAAQVGDPERFKSLFTSSNGESKAYLTEKRFMSEEEIAHFVLGVFAYAINKNIELAARPRKKRKLELKRQRRFEQPLEELFESLQHYQRHFFLCGDQQNMIRNYFYEFGKLLNGSRFTHIPENTLNCIKEAPVGAFAGEEIPRIRLD